MADAKEEEQVAAEAGGEEVKPEEVDEVKAEEAEEAKPEAEKPAGATEKEAAKEAADKENAAKQEQAQRMVAEAEHARADQVAAVRAEMSALYTPDAEALQALASGLVGVTAPLVEATAERLHLLHSKQLALIARLAQEDRKVMTLPHMADVAQALAHVPVYAARLQEMRADMHAITARVKAMRKRAQKLYTKKQQEDAITMQSRQAAIQKDKEALK
mmetsp:Transcript_22086/g.52989  ORF Transcript_22086/g.52989 Transcript_22086/m.52989 type:complete len:217 (-) Transcript_22086:115-765(-)